MARHGQPAWNAEGRFQGQADPPLDVTGWAQAARLATEVTGLRPDVLVSSDLLRARQTATVLSRAWGLEIVFDSDLREIDLGGWEGLYHHQAAERFPEEYRLWSEGGDPPRGGGETEARGGTRAAASLHRIVDAAPGSATVVVVSHGLVLRSAMGVLAEEGTIGPSGVPPHLGNGQWVALEVAAAVAG
ncbi:MAG: histidine phosphatase family protein [Actinomycetota bacterium]|nr:histidine phosphatase family protein [Actinomycetota bacterium]